MANEDWTNPAAMEIPKEGFFEREMGRFGPIDPRTTSKYLSTI